MPEFQFEQSNLWRRTLARQANDEWETSREFLRTAFMKMRLRAEELVKLIPKDCQHLTVHDATHLDALWEMEDIIAGETFEMNPAEAFVFGAAVLIHDAGMTVAAYPGGLPSIKVTTEWTDTVASILRQRGNSEIKAQLLSDPPAEIYEEALFNTLRALHAKHAQDLIAISWPKPSTGEPIRLLEDSDLRQAYGRSIGKIAYSHHWDISEVETRLRRTAGVAPRLPREWDLDEVKVACALRCCDAAHIDQRRAPTMLFALTKPTNIARRHWTFQNKLMKPVRHENVLTYTSNEDFNANEADAWWLCYDTIQMIQKELIQCDALLQDSQRPRFAANRVFGAESPRTLARQITPAGWQPILAEIKVSDPAQLAQTLGGRNLYGAGAFAPIRELLQNSVDAIRARRKLEDGNEDWGRVRLVIEEEGSSAKKELWLHVDDDGVGMSERVLVGPLLDFGKSFWNSSLLQEEFPGLESRGIKPIGKYGIGFFSIFLLGQHVKIISRRYDAGAGDTRVLQFTSIGTRPLLRNAESGELPKDYNTRVSVKIDDPKILESPVDDLNPDFRFRKSSRSTEGHRALLERIRQLTAALDVDFELLDMTAAFKTYHSAGWTSVPAAQFLEEVTSGILRGQELQDVVRAHAPQLDVLRDAEGRVYGRAALGMFKTASTRYGVRQSVSVGGFVYPGRDEGLPFLFGVLVGDTEIVSRSFAHQRVPRAVISEWASRQAAQIDRSRFFIFDLLDACHTVLDLEGNSAQLPFCFLGGKFLTLSEASNAFASLNAVHLPLKKRYDENFDLLRIADLTTSYYLHHPQPSVTVVHVEELTKIFNDEERAKSLIRETPVTLEEDDCRKIASSTPGELLLDALAKVWGSPPRWKLEEVQLFSGSYFRPVDKRWVITLSRE